MKSKTPVSATPVTATIADFSSASTEASLQSPSKAEAGTSGVHPRYVKWLKNLLGMIVTLMALGAFVRTMKAGLACPDWPLCFGKVIPDWHPGVWLEFVHRADAGLVALVFFGCFIYSFRSAAVPKAAKRAAIAGLSFLVVQIAMGGLTVLWLVKKYVVTAHLMLATFFYVSVLWMLFNASPRIERARTLSPRWPMWAAAVISLGVLAQIFMGGLVAATYSGSVCVDWPLCNGQWVPTWSGAIGLQIMHRFTAYALAALIIGLGTALHFQRNASWMTKQLKYLILANMAIVVLQIAIGVANLILFIPAWLTVLHQTVALALLTVNLRLFFVARATSSVT